MAHLSPLFVRLAELPPRPVDRPRGPAAHTPQTCLLGDHPDRLPPGKGRLPVDPSSQGVACPSSATRTGWPLVNSTSWSKVVANTA